MLTKLPEKNCLNCESFCWWDGDYCCFWNMKILCNSPKGEMNEDILISIEKNKDCKDWKRTDKYSRKEYSEAFEDFMSKRK